MKRKDVKSVVLIVLLIIAVVCGVLLSVESVHWYVRYKRDIDNPCWTCDKKHEFGKWETCSRPYFGNLIEGQRRTCNVCGYTEGRDFDYGSY